MDLTDQLNESYIHLFSKNGSSYDKIHSFISYDLKFISIVFIFSTAFLLIIIISPGYKGKERYYLLIRTLASLLIGFNITACNFGYYWKYDYLIILTKLKPSSSIFIAEVGLYIGLRGFNITLIGLTSDFQKIPSINYNENISWAWKLSKGSEYSKLEEEYRKTKKKGLPLAIQWIGEYFKLTGGYFSFGRQFRIAGWYAHVFIWLSFALWILTNICFFMAVSYGAIGLVTIGLSLIISNISYHLFTHSLNLSIPFESPIECDTIFLTPNYGWCFYFNLVNGIFCLIIGLLIYFFDIIFPEATSKFFAIDITLDLDEHLEKMDSPKASTDNDNETAKFSYATIWDKVQTSRLSRISHFMDKKTPTNLKEVKTQIETDENNWYSVPKIIKKKVEPQLELWQKHHHRITLDE